MPISKKIIREIDELSETPEIKELMKEILILEDNGVKRWNKDYDKIINDFIKIYKNNCGEREQ